MLWFLKLSFMLSSKPVLLFSLAFYFLLLCHFVTESNTQKWNIVIEFSDYTNSGQTATRLLIDDCFDSFCFVPFSPIIFRRTQHGQQMVGGDARLPIGISRPQILPKMLIWRFQTHKRLLHSSSPGELFSPLQLNSLVIRVALLALERISGCYGYLTCYQCNIFYCSPMKNLL